MRKRAQPKSIGIPFARKGTYRQAAGRLALGDACSAQFETWAAGKPARGRVTEQMLESTA